MPPKASLFLLYCNCTTSGLYIVKYSKGSKRTVNIICTHEIWAQFAFATLVLRVIIS